MPVYLDEEMMGTDPYVVAFPHLVLCLGVVCTTKRNLYGLHLSNLDRTDTAMDFFVDWLGSIGVTGNSIQCVYGSGNWPIRYKVAETKANPVAEWKSEMTQIAGKLGYRGLISGFDTSVIEPTQGTYVEYVSKFPMPNCRIFYKRNEKIDYTFADGSKPLPNVARIARFTGQLEAVRLGKTAISVKSSKSDQGQLREVDYSTRLISFLRS